MKIKIGNQEYEPPFETESSAYDCPHSTVSDEAGNQVSSWDITIALNELSQLRADNAALVKEIAALRQQLYEIPLAEVIIAENKQLRQERDELIKRVEELEKQNARMNGAIYDWFYARRDYQSLHPGNHTSEEKAHTVERYLTAERVLVESIKPDTKGGEK